MRRGLILLGALAAFATGAGAQDRAPDGRAYRAQPLTTELFIADPSAHVFDGRVYVYGSHDIQGPPADDQPGKGFVMKDYVVLSMDRIGGPVTIHPTAFTLADVPWADRQLWAPDAAYKDGRYYLYFPAKDRDGVFRIGVATGERPEGPFTPQPLPIPGAYSIDPSVFVDEDGAAYLYVGGIHGGQLQRWASGRYDPTAGDTDLNQPDAASLMPKVARLSDDMLSLAEPLRDAVILDEQGEPLKGGDLDRRFFEAAWLHRHNGLYYLSYSTGDTHFIAYATATTPYGPFTYRGRVLLPVQGWTTHHSIVEVEGQWRLFYHDTQLSNRTHLRSAKVIDLHHKADGSIRTIDPFIAPQLRSVRVTHNEKEEPSMTPINRRTALSGLLGGVAASALPVGAVFAQTNEEAAPLGREWAGMKWRKGIEGQRMADLGDGTFLNPIMSGDHPDPSIVKDGDDYYMTFSSFESVPGIHIWHSRDLVNWRPITAALTTNIGSVWAPELIKHEGRFYCYIPARFPNYRSNYVIWADKIEGPWSEPIDLKISANIDPGHIVGEDGKRYLFLNGGDRVRLTDDGLATDGPLEQVYDAWRYPEDWIVEGHAQEGPKLLRHGDYFYMITAIGGTAGPPTGHMVIAARSKSIHGPWEECPHNPIVRTRSGAEKWWSRGHATLVEGPTDGDWWMVYHGYENAYWSLGRQTLLDPIEWTDDGWFRAKGGDLSKPIPMPRGGQAVPHGMALSDDFTTDKFGTQWSFYDPQPNEKDRLRRENGALHMKAKGKAPVDCSPLTFVQGEQAYQIECEIEIDPGAVAGLILFYDRALYAGLGFDPTRYVTHQYGIERGRPANPHGRRMFMRLTNAYQNVYFDTSADGVNWKRFDRGMEVSGYNQNVRGGFMMLRPGIYAAGEGEARFKNFKFRAL